MKLKKIVLRNIVFRYNLKKKELQIKSLKILLRLQFLNYISLLNVYSKLTKEGFYSKIKNTCFITSKSKGVYKKFSLSRFKVKELGGNGFLLGLKKYSW